MNAPRQTLWIDGAARPSESGEVIEVLDPATERPVGVIPAATDGDVAACVAAARRAAPAWAAAAPTARRTALLAVADRILAHREEIAELLVRENGKPRREALAEVTGAAAVARSFAELAVHLRSGAQGSADGELNFQHRVPRGVAAVIVPWNYPIMLAVENVVPNLAVGNTVVLKPSEKTPLSTRLLIARAFGDLPAGVVNLVLGAGPTGEALVRADGVDVVVFVGSEATGRRIGTICGRRLARAVLELGGKDAFIVDETADVAAAARLAAETTYQNAGQICTSTERLYVQRAVFDEFVERLVAESRALRVGPGSDDATRMGPLIDVAQLERVTTHVTDALTRGARAHCGGRRLDRPGYFFPPTVLTGVDPDAPLMVDETFGPVAPVAAFDDFDEAIALANASRFGLAAIVCTESAPHALRAIDRLDAGMIKINTTRGKAPGATSEPARASGLGHGYGVEFLYEITRQKSVHWRARLP